MSILYQIDINCDMGEWSSRGLDLGDPLAKELKESDAAIMPHISSANIACGAHAGDAISMAHTIRLAMQHGVAIGAHPGYPDPAGFGRRNMKIKPDDLFASLKAQIMEVKTMAERLGTKVCHVKPHGALYNEAAADERLARLIVKCVKEIDQTMVLFGLPGSALEKASHEGGIRFAKEAFADRAYHSNGNLLTRTLPAAVLHHVEEMVVRTLTMITEGYVMAHDGNKLMIKADTICIHGDNPVAHEFVMQLKSTLAAAGIHIRPPGRRED